MVGDYVLLPDHENIWQEDFVRLNQDAGQEDGQAMGPRIRPATEWVVEMISLDEPNCDKIASWDVPGAELSPADRQEREDVRDEIDQRITGNLRHHGILAPELDRGTKGRRPIRKTNVDAGGWVPLRTVKRYIQS